MYGLTFHGKETVHYESISDPEIKSPTDAIVKTRIAGICGSDLHPYHEREKGLDHGTVMGHEFVGEVVEIGTAVTSLQIGDLVVSPFTTNCGICYYCLKGLTCRCIYGNCYGWVEGGKGLQGAQAQYVHVPLAESTLVHLANGVTMEEGVLLGDILSTGYFCADMAEIQPKGVYVVIGCGPVGLMAILGAIELGAEKLYAIDSIPQRLNHAQRFGAIPIDYTSTDPVEIIRDATDGRGADAVLEVVGNPSAARLSVDLVRPCGIISAVGMHTEEHIAFSPIEAYNKNLTFKAGRCPVRFYIEQLMPLVQNKKYDYTSIITHKMSLQDGVHGYHIFDKKEDGCLKVMLKPE